MNETKSIFYSEIGAELDAILSYWKEFGIDEDYGGFVGRRNHQNQQIEQADKGIILNTRILWTFSAAGNFIADPDLQAYADRAFEYLRDHFEDRGHQGVYWEVDFKGNPINTRKQIYAQAFAIYALSEYHIYSGNQEAKDWALSLFHLVEEKAWDSEENGYFEAFQRDWTPIEDMRLSDKDRNSAKTMNTHLHILEAYTTLLKINREEEVRIALENLIVLFFTKFYDRKTQHFNLFFSKDWKKEGRLISYGHDIEAVWLLVEAAKVSKNQELLSRAEELVLEVARTFLKEAYVPGKGVINEANLDLDEVDTDRHWWPHAEAMVGMDYALQLSGDQKFEEVMLDIWDFTKRYLIDSVNGEWFFRIDEDNRPYKEEDKVGMWKCPYHNTRACIMLLQMRR